MLVSFSLPAEMKCGRFWSTFAKKKEEAVWLFRSDLDLQQWMYFCTEPCHIILLWIAEWFDFWKTFLVFIVKHVKVFVKYHRKWWQICKTLVFTVNVVLYLSFSLFYAVNGFWMMLDTSRWGSYSNALFLALRIYSRTSIHKSLFFFPFFFH